MFSPGGAVRRSAEAAALLSWLLACLLPKLTQAARCRCQAASDATARRSLDGGRLDLPSSRLRHEFEEHADQSIREFLGADEPRPPDFFQYKLARQGNVRNVVTRITLGSEKTSIPSFGVGIIPEHSTTFRPQSCPSSSNRLFQIVYYSSLDALVGALDEKIIRPAEVRFVELLARKAEKMKGEHV